MIGKVCSLHIPGSQYVDYDEYLALLKDHMKDPQIVEIELREAFRVFDRNRNNNLDFAELKKAVTHLGEPLSDKQAIELCKLMDTNGDNQVDVEGINILSAYCKGGNFNIHIWAWFRYFICYTREIRFYL